MHAIGTEYFDIIMSVSEAAWKEKEKSPDLFF